MACIKNRKQRVTMWSITLLPKKLIYAGIVLGDAMDIY